MNNLIVVSAVNLVQGGPLTILQKCLAALSNMAISQEFEVIAIVHDKELCNYPHIKYIEIPWAKKHWINRVYFEYRYSKRLSKELKPHLWLSLHDMTPNVYADIRAVYCHNPSPFFNPPLKHFFTNYKEYLFSKFYKYLYKFNIHRNDYVIVQQNWLKQSFMEMFSLNKKTVIVAKPTEEKNGSCILENNISNSIVQFFYPAFPRTFKNFEVICQACVILEEMGVSNFKVVLTLSGTENAYAKSIYKRYEKLPNISFCGLLPYEKVIEEYGRTNCLIFPSMLETWGLPISEFIPFNKPMILADLPYAYETAAGAKKAVFFNPNDARELACQMKNLIDNNIASFHKINHSPEDSESINSWETLITTMLNRNYPPPQQFNKLEHVHAIRNRYSLVDKICLGVNVLRTKLISRRARIIRFPFRLRGKEYIEFGKGFTTGYNCRIEAFEAAGIADDKKIVFGKNVQLNDNVHISSVKLVEIGDNVLMASQIYISDNSHGSYKGDDYDSFPDTPPTKRPYFVAPVKIGDNVWIGEGVIIMPGVTVGRGCVIGAHSIVNRDIPDYCIAVGSPAKVVKKYSFENNHWIAVNKSNN